ncbi:MAG: hypothetical protein FWB86_11910, partial [Treponema sp.]|nr:hypothetical protein [Treponema sp.]
MKHLEQTILKAIALSEKTRREGLLAAEDELYDLDESGLDILSYGMRLAVDGTDSQLIEKILTNMISRENDEKAKLLKIIQKEAVLCIQCGYNTRILALKLLSYLEENESRVIEGKILSDDIFIDDLDSDDAENIPPPSPVIPMDKDEFLSQAAATIKLVYSFSNKARREGLLSLEDELEDLDDEFLKMGLRLVVDGTDSTIINDIMSNKTDIEKDSSRKKLKTIQKIAVLSIQAGDNSSLMVHKIISLVDNPGLTVISKTLDGLDFFKKNDFKNDNPLEKEGRKFNELAADIIQKACMFSEKVIKNEISSLSSIIDKSKKDERGIFEY